MRELINFVIYWIAICISFLFMPLWIPVTCYYMMRAIYEDWSCRDFEDWMMMYYPVQWTHEKFSSKS